MLLAARGPGHFGFSFRQENPAYATINYQNLPSAEELYRNAADPRRSLAFRHNLEEEIRLGRAAGSLVVLSTVPFLSEKYASGVIVRDERTLAVISQQVNRNNDITRAVATATHAPLVDPALHLSRGELLPNDCHFNAQGERAFADLILHAITEALAHQLIS